MKLFINNIKLLFSLPKESLKNLPECLRDEMQFVFADGVFDVINDLFHSAEHKRIA
jgi:hypothetical protein